MALLAGMAGRCAARFTAQAAVNGVSGCAPRVLAAPATGSFGRCPHRPPRFRVSWIRRRPGQSDEAMAAGA